MRFKIDENLPRAVAALLRAAGHEADTVQDEGLTSAPDSHLAAVCASENRVLITLDTDFANILVHPPSGTAGFIVLRLNRHDKTWVLDVVRRMLPRLSEDAIRGRLWIVDGLRIRIHG